MPDWIVTVAAVILGVAIIRAMMAWINRTPPPPWRDPKLSEREKDEAWTDWQW